MCLFFHIAGNKYRTVILSGHFKSSPKSTRFRNVLSLLIVGCTYLDKIQCFVTHHLKGFSRSKQRLELFKDSIEIGRSLLSSSAVGLLIGIKGVWLAISNEIHVAAFEVSTYTTYTHILHCNSKYNLPSLRLVRSVRPHIIIARLLWLLLWERENIKYKITAVQRLSYYFWTIPVHKSKRLHH